MRSRRNQVITAVPPILPTSTVPRPRLERLLDEGAARRLTTVVADAGSGKSTLLAAWAGRRRCAWYTVTPADRSLHVLAAGLLDALSLWIPGIVADVGELGESGQGPDASAEEGRRAQAMAAALADAVRRRLARDLVLVLDDVQELARTDASTRLVESLCRQAPPLLHVVLASRHDPPFAIERLRAQGQVLTIGGAALAFTPDETLAALGSALDDGAAGIAAELHEATGGWPAAVRLAAEALRHVAPESRATALRRLVRPGGQIFDFLAEEAIAGEPAWVRRLIAVVAPFERFSPGLCDALGLRDAAATLAALERRGLFVQSMGDGEWYVLHPLVRQYAADRLAPDRTTLRRLRRQAAAWLAASGDEPGALGLIVATGDRRAIARFLEERGPALLAAEAVEALIAGAERLHPADRSPAIDQLEGEARQVRGDWEGALACFRRSTAGNGPIPAAIAWRMGLIFHLRGELDEALAVYERGVLEPQSGRRRSTVSRASPASPAPPVEPVDGRPDRARLRAWWASALWLRGDRERCRELAMAALADATESGDHRALAATHTVLAMLAALDGDRRANDAQYLRALDHAERAGDVLQQIRIRANRGSRFVEEGYYGEAVEELDIAIRLSDLAGFAAFRALALSNRGEALRRMGRFDEAIADLEAARAIYQRLESRLVSYPLGHLGDIYRLRGDGALARSCYEEAIAVAESGADLQGLVPALAGLARTLAADDPDRAAVLAARAVAAGPVLAHVGALVAAGWVALATGDAEAARRAASDAATTARGRRDRAGLAESIELEVAASPDGQRATERLAEALAIWRDVRNVLGVARVQWALARLGEGAAARALAEEATLGFRAVGARPPAEWPSPPEVAAPAAGDDHRPLEIRTLGGFEVVRAGQPVRLGEWRSKKARDLLKILVGRRGARVPRDQLLELLWPDEDPARSSRRLSVALSTVRAVLDPDRRQQPHHHLGADRTAVWLVRDRAAIDVEDFLDAANAGLALAAAGRAGEALTELTAAEAAYRGDVFPEDIYEEWSAALREEARSGYIRVGHALAAMASSAGDAERAAALLRRILERDAYDERAHLDLAAALVAAGRHGEARRAYQAYLARMEELEVEPAPFPG